MVTATVVVVSLAEEERFPVGQPGMSLSGVSQVISGGMFANTLTCQAVW